MPFDIQIGENLVEVEFDQIKKVDDNFVLQSQGDYDRAVGKAKGQVEQRLIKDRDDALVKQRTDLFEDNEFFGEIAKTRGIELDESGHIVKELPQDKVRELKDGWRRDELDPEKERGNLLEKQISKSRHALLMRDIQAEAAAAGLRKELLSNTLYPDRPGHIVYDIAESARWNDDDGSYYFIDDKSGDPLLNNDGQRATAKDVVDRIKRKDKDRNMFEDNRPRGSGGSGNKDAPPNSKNGKAMTMSEFQKLTPIKQSELSLGPIRRGEMVLVDDSADV